MRILHIIQNLNIGGAERMVIDLCSALERQGHDCCIVPIYPDGQLEDVAMRRGLRVVGAHRRKGFDLGHLWRLGQIIKAEGADIVHTHTYSGKYWGRLAAMCVGCRIVHTEHGRVPSSKSLFERFADMVLNRASSVIVAVSEDVRQSILATERLPPERVLVVRNGIDVDRFISALGDKGLRHRLALDPSRFIMLMVGRLEPPKNHYLAIRALQVLARTGAAVELWIVGGGSLRDQLKAEVARLRLADRVVFFGPQGDVLPYLRSADAFLLSSDTEGLPLALLEAMASALPVIATAVGGIPEVLADRTCGVLVPPANEETMARAILDLKAAPVANRAMGDRAREVVKANFTIGRMADDYAAVYQKASAGK